MNKFQFGNSVAAEALIEILEEQNNPLLQRKVSALFSSFNAKLKTLYQAGITNQFFYKITLEHIEKEIDYKDWTLELRKFLKNCCRAQYRTYIRKLSDII